MDKISEDFEVPEDIDAFLDRHIATLPTFGSITIGSQLEEEMGIDLSHLLSVH